MLSSRGIITVQQGRELTQILWVMASQSWRTWKPSSPNFFLVQLRKELSTRWGNSAEPPKTCGKLAWSWGPLNTSRLKHSAPWWPGSCTVWSKGRTESRHSALCPGQGGIVNPEHNFCWQCTARSAQTHHVPLSSSPPPSPHSQNYVEKTHKGARWFTWAFCVTVFKERSCLVSLLLWAPAITKGPFPSNQLPHSLSLTFPKLAVTDDIHLDLVHMESERWWWLWPRGCHCSRESCG